MKCFHQTFNRVFKSEGGILGFSPDTRERKETVEAGHLIIHYADYYD
jgi:hypothetical protein